MRRLTLLALTLGAAMLAGCDSGRARLAGSSAFAERIRIRAAEDHPNQTIALSDAVKARELQKVENRTRSFADELDAQQWLVQPQDNR